MFINLGKLKQYNEIYVIGHKKPDIDTIVSSKILSEIFKFFGINSEYVVIENQKPDEYNKKMIDDCMRYNPKIIKTNEIPNAFYFLVDHNDLKQSVENKDLVVGCIDHHLSSGLELEDNMFLTDYCCTALYIYEMFKNVYPFSDEQKKQIYMAFLNDSTFGKSSRYTNKDEILARTLGFNDSYAELFKKYFIPTDISKEKELVFNNNGYKSFDFGGLKFESSYIERLDINGIEDYKKFVKSLQKNFLGIWKDYSKSKTYTFLKYDELFKEEVYDFLASRATTILNDTLDYLGEPKNKIK